jgi:hypothetical protein
MIIKLLLGRGEGNRKREIQDLDTCDRKVSNDETLYFFEF